MLAFHQQFKRYLISNRPLNRGRISSCLSAKQHVHKQLAMPRPVASLQEQQSLKGSLSCFHPGDMAEETNYKNVFS
jgi:hypothetical protein